MASKKNFYAVVRGRKPGIYQEWFGEKGAEVQIKGFPDALYKGFVLKQEAVTWFEQMGQVKSQLQFDLPASNPPSAPTPMKPEIDPQNPVRLFTDGGCLNNPGPGGYGVVRKIGMNKKEYSGGYRLTTNNRMELMACIVGLQSLKTPAQVTLFSDSKYVVDGMMKGWAKRWRKNGWKRNQEENAENIDLWDQLLELCDFHRVQFKWVKGHAGHPENERCDQLARKAAKVHGLPRDNNYESGQTQMPVFKVF